MSKETLKIWVLCDSLCNEYYVKGGNLTLGPFADADVFPTRNVLKERMGRLNKLMQDAEEHYGDWADEHVELAETYDDPDKESYVRSIADALKNQYDFAMARRHLPNYGMFEIELEISDD
jgi:hypothetical protein